MTKIFEISTTKFDEDENIIKKSMWDLEALCKTTNSFQLSEPISKFGWTFIKLAIKENLFILIQEKFYDMIEKERGKKQEEKFTNFLTDYFTSKGCSIKLKLLKDD